MVPRKATDVSAVPSSAEKGVEAGVRLEEFSGSLFGEPQLDCHATHRPAAVAYNVSSPLESSHENRQ